MAPGTGLCCYSLYPSAYHHSALVNNVYPSGPGEEGPRHSSLSLLLYYARNKPPKLAKIGPYLLLRLRSDLARHRFGYVKITLIILNALLDECSENAHLMVTSTLRIIDSVLSSPDLDMFILFSRTHQHDRNQSEEVDQLFTGILHKFSGMAEYTSSALLHDQCKTQLSGFNGIQAILANPTFAADSRKAEYLQLLLPVLLGKLGRAPPRPEPSVTRESSLRRKASSVSSRQSLVLDSVLQSSHEIDNICKACIHHLFDRAPLGMVELSLELLLRSIPEDGKAFVSILELIKAAVQPQYRYLLMKALLAHLPVSPQPLSCLAGIQYLLQNPAHSNAGIAVVEMLDVLYTQASKAPGAFYPYVEVIGSLITVISYAEQLADLLVYLGCRVADPLAFFCLYALAKTRRSHVYEKLPPRCPFGVELLQPFLARLDAPSSASAVAGARPRAASDPSAAFDPTSAVPATDHGATGVTGPPVTGSPVAQPAHSASCRIALYQSLWILFHVEIGRPHFVFTSPGTGAPMEEFVQQLFHSYHALFRSTLSATVAGAVDSGTTPAPPSLSQAQTHHQTLAYPSMMRMIFELLKQSIGLVGPKILVVTIPVVYALHAMCAQRVQELQSAGSPATTANPNASDTNDPAAPPERRARVLALLRLVSSLVETVLLDYLLGICALFNLAPFLQELQQAKRVAQAAKLYVPGLEDDAFMARRMEELLPILPSLAEASEAATGTGELPSLLGSFLVPRTVVMEVLSPHLQPLLAAADLAHLSEEYAGALIEFATPTTKVSTRRSNSSRHQRGKSAVIAASPSDSAPAAARQGEGASMRIPFSGSVSSIARKVRSTRTDSTDAMDTSIGHGMTIQLDELRDTLAVSPSRGKGDLTSGWVGAAAAAATASGLPPVAGTGHPDAGHPHHHTSFPRKLMGSAARSREDVRHLLNSVNQLFSWKERNVSATTGPRSGPAGGGIPLGRRPLHLGRNGTFLGIRTPGGGGGSTNANSGTPASIPAGPGIPLQDMRQSDGTASVAPAGEKEAEVGDDGGGARAVLGGSVDDAPTPTPAPTSPSRAAAMADGNGPTHLEHTPKTTRSSMRDGLERITKSFSSLNPVK